jgi:negative regulator of sigma E activity
MLRSVLAAALSAVVVLGVVSGLTGKSSDDRAADIGTVVMPVGNNATDDSSWN